MVFDDYKMETLLLNLFFIIFPFLFYQFIFKERIAASPIVKNALLYCIFTIPILLCMVFPVSNTNGFQINLHTIPFIMACFYSSPIVSVLIYISTIVARLSIGGGGQYITLISDTLAIVVAFLLMNAYRSMKLPTKIVILCFISIGSKVIGKFANQIIDPDYVMNLHITFYLNECLFMAITLYTIEAILKNIQLKNDLVDSEKIKIASVIAASVAHEIRNPLTSVRGFIQLLCETSDITHEKRQMYGRICLEELDRAQQIINDYLALAKPYPDVIEQIDIGEEITYVSTVLTSYGNLKGVELQVETEENLYVSGDRQKLRQSIINIGKNGIEAMEHGGVLEFKAKKHNKEVILIICDSGLGMTSEQVNRLGTPYFSTKDKGTGLGTLVSFNIIKNMLGKIKVESKVGVGTSFRISFPAEAKPNFSE
jgi:two-component system, sporulation sensor kinase B